jgi:exodeoxyribonuclease VII large subunit
MSRDYYTVSKLTQRIKTLIELEFDDIWVRGEVVGLKVHSSGHYYFSLKDRGAKVGGVVFRGSARFLQVLPREGQELLCHGRLDLYAPQGSYKLIVDQTEEVGSGALAEQLERLKKKLASEGLFDQDRKQELPYLPKKIGIVTSPTSAAIKDMVRTIHDRYPAHILLYPVRVQGETAAQELVQGLKALDQRADVDVIIIGRGGGALEDLLAFSDEALVRAVAEAATPIISAVGHEIDFPLCDLAADMRAATPTAAAEAVVPRITDIRSWLDRMAKQLELGLRPLDDAMLKLGELADRLERSALATMNTRALKLNQLELKLQRLHPATRFSAQGAKLQLLGQQLENIMNTRLERSSEQLSKLEGLINAYGPRQQMARGWSVIKKADTGKVVTSLELLSPGDQVELMTLGGEALATVDQLIKN